MARITDYGRSSKDNIVLGGSASFGLSYKTNDGYSFSWSKLRGYTPKRSRIEKACIFAAAKKKGKWAGIRLYMD